jgi:hypothetical protein
MVRSDMGKDSSFEASGSNGLRERRFGMRDQRTRTRDLAAVPAAGSPSPQRIRWGAVFAGVVLGTALLALLSTLWFALAFNSNVDTIRVNLEWYVGVTAVVALFIGGLLAGWLSGVRGAGSGLFNGITMWGLILIVALAIGIPAVFNVFNLGRVTAIAEGNGTTLTSSGVAAALWASFWTILGGFLASGLGGMIGGAITMPANAQLSPVTDEHMVDVTHDEGDIDDEDIDADHDHRDDRVTSTHAM